MTLPAQMPFGAVSFEKEWAFLCQCASPSTTKVRIAETTATDLNWDVLLNLGEEHGVLGVVAFRLQQMGYDGVPSEARQKFQQRMRAQHLFTLSMTAELFRILQDFHPAESNAC